MIYAYNKKVTSKQESYIFPHQLDAAIKNLSYRLEDQDIRYWKLSIPRDYARMESSKKFYHVEDIEDVPHYEIYLIEQRSDSRFQEDTLVYFRLPNSDKLFTVLIDKNNMVSFNKHDHKFILRESDELDRRVILGFCKMYAGNISSVCKNMEGIYGENGLPWLKREAMVYKASMQPKRIKAGCYSRSNMYGENSIFTNIVMI